MNFVSLAIHGLSAISVFGDRVGVRVLTAASVFIGLTVCFLFVTLIGGWVTSWRLTHAVSLLLVMLFQLLFTSFFGVFLILHGRDSSSIIPLRDHEYFVSELRVLQSAKELTS